MDDGTHPRDRSFERPWEEDDEDTFDLGDQEPSGDVSEDDSAADEVADVVELGADRSGDDVDLTDWEAMAAGSGRLDDYTDIEYSAASTQEYRGLAEEVSRASEEEWQLQAVAATVPGVDSGLVGFEDVTGNPLDAEEAYELHEQAASSDMAMRIASALIIFGMFLGSLLLGGWWFTGFVALVMIVGTGEYFATARFRGYAPVALFGLAGSVLMALGAHTAGPVAIGAWAAAISALTILLFSLSVRKNPLENAAVTVVGMVWVGMLSFAVLIGNGPDPVANIMLIVLLVALNDSGAFFVGRAFGRRKLAPSISPNKSIEGLIGGSVVTFAVAAVLATFPPWEHIGFGRAMAAALVVSLATPLGDAIESMVKRSLGVKDMGSVLPGHGGILDRIDGFLVVVPAIYVLFRGFGLL
jgi:phosphatidate cytidylyltransferase